MQTRANRKPITPKLIVKNTINPIPSDIPKNVVIGEIIV